MKKLLALMLAAAMLLAVCSVAVAEELPTITIMFHGSNVTDDTAVLEAVNDYIADKVGAKLEVVWGTWGDFDDKATNALLSGDSGIDMVFTCSWSADEYNTYAKNGYFVKLDDLIAEYGADLTAAVGRGNVVGCQFHPEKSGDVGLGILKAFCEWDGLDPLS